MLRHRLWLCVVLLLLAGPLAAQQVASTTPQEWQADARANKRAQKAAVKAAKVAMPPRKGGEAAPPGGPGGGPPPGGMGGSGGPDGGQGEGGPGGGGQGPGGEGGPPPGGGKGGHGPGGPGGGRFSVTAEVMLRPEMDFAAPLDDTLVLYRTRDAVMFGSKQSQNVVILPLSGQSVSIAPGVTAAIHDENGALRLEMTTSNGIHVTDRYLIQDNVLKVAVHAEGPFPHPGSHFDVERTYHVSQSRH